MVIGTAALVLGGASILGGAVSAMSASSAANKATRASQQATDSNNALSRDIYAQNSATLAPFVAQGGAATSYINQLLGIQAPATSSVAGATGAGMGSAYVGGINGTPGYSLGRTRGNEDFAYNGSGFDPNIQNNYQLGPQGGGSPAAASGAAPPLAPGTAANGLEMLRNSSAYQFRRSEGERGIAGNQTVKGLLNSGSTLKGLGRFYDGLAAQSEDTFYNRIAGQQGVGLSAASAQAGVANNYSAQVQNSNSVNASNIGNAAIAKGNATGNFVNGLMQAGAYAYGGR